jgi:hypothetical protein
VVINFRREIILEDSTAGRPLTEEEKKRAAAALERLGRPHRRKSLALQLLLFAVVLALWTVPMINPIKLVVVLLHELSHVFAAYLTGGVVFGIAIDPGGAGVTIGYGGNDLLIVSAGYIGSLLMGFLLYAMSAKYNCEHVWGGLCIFVGLTPVLGWLNGFTALFGYGAMILILFGYFALSPTAKKFFLRWIATTCCLYPVLDVTTEILQPDTTGFVVRGEVAGSDVAKLAELTGIPEIALAVTWIAIGVFSAGLLILWSATKDAEATVKRSFLVKEDLVPILYHKYDPKNPDNIPRYVIR